MLPAVSCASQTMGSASSLIRSDSTLTAVALSTVEGYHCSWCVEMSQLAAAAAAAAVLRRSNTPRGRLCVGVTAAVVYCRRYCGADTTEIWASNRTLCNRLGFCFWPVEVAAKDLAGEGVGNHPWVTSHDVTVCRPRLCDINST